MLKVNGNQKNSLKVKTIGVNAYEALINLKNPATVEGTFESSFYINVGDNKLLRTIKHDEYISVSSILINENDQNFSFKTIGIEKGMELVHKNNNILIGDRLLIADIDSIAKWHSPTAPDNSVISEMEIIKLNLRVLRDVIYTCPSREGLVPLLENLELLGSIEMFLKPQKDSFVERARPGIERTMWALFSYDIDTVLNSTNSITGLGPGLTPSCDDFLAGLILSLKIGSEVLNKNGQEDKLFFSDVAKKIYDQAQGKTTVFSLNMLREACEEVCPLAVINLIYSLLTKDPDQVAKDSKTVVRMGETSGADIAIGIFYGIRFLISKFENLEVFDETA